MSSMKKFYKEVLEKEERKDKELEEKEEELFDAIIKLEEHYRKHNNNILERIIDDYYANYENILARRADIASKITYYEKLYYAAD